jgi:hypothetical protein
MIQGKSHHAESRAKTRKASAAQNRIQGKTTTALRQQRLVHPAGDHLALRVADERFGRMGLGQYLGREIQT